MGPDPAWLSAWVSPASAAWRRGWLLGLLRTRSRSEADDAQG